MSNRNDNKGSGNHNKRSRPTHHCGSLPELHKQIIKKK